MPSKRGDFAIGILEDKVVCAGGLGMGTCSTLIYNWFMRFRTNSFTW